MKQEDSPTPTFHILDSLQLRADEVNRNQDAPSRLSRIETMWSVVFRAHEDSDERSGDAQALLLQRYEDAIRRYLQGAVRDSDLADELFQEFALRFVKGDFRSADPSRGKFRSFVKTILFRMVADHFRKKKRTKEIALGDRSTAAEPVDHSAEQPDKKSEEMFLINWREEVLNQTWNALEQYEANGGGPYFTVLTIRVENPSLDSKTLAETLSQRLGKETSPGSARVLVHRSRDKFAQCLIELVANSLAEPSDDAIEQELIDLRLIDYCREAIAERTQPK